MLVNDILSVLNEDMEIDLLVYRKESIASDLSGNIHFIPWNKLAQKTKRISFLGSLPKSMCRDYACYTIDLTGYDKVIYYPYHAALFQVKNCNAVFYTIGMDSGPMLYLRGFLNHKRFISKVFCLYYFFLALYMDWKATELSTKVFTVGEADAEFYRSVYLADARYVHHPITDSLDSCQPVPWEENQRLRVFFPGSLTRFYAKGLVEDILDLLIGKADYYKERIELSFLRVQYKKLSKKIRQLEAVGFQVENVEFAENFEEYLSNHHLAICPLITGAGTKNKTLSLLGMGMDMIGSPITMENVYGVKKEHIATDAGEFIRLIDLRLQNHKLYGLSKAEITLLKEYHSVKNWKTYFWEEIR